MLQMEQKMFHIEQKNVRVQNLLQIEQNTLQKEHKMFAKDIIALFFLLHFMGLAWSCMALYGTWPCMTFYGLV